MTETPEADSGQANTETVDEVPTDQPAEEPATAEESEIVIDSEIVEEAAALPTVIILCIYEKLPTKHYMIIL